MPFNVKCRKCLYYKHAWCDKKLDSPDPDLERNCLYYSAATNGDRFRAKSDEELAQILSKKFCPHVLGATVTCNASSKGCYECWLGWFRKDADE